MDLEQLSTALEHVERIPASSLEQGDEVFTPQGFWRKVTGVLEYQLAYMNGRTVGNVIQPWKVLHVQHEGGGMVVFATAMILRKKIEAWTEPTLAP